MGIFLLATCALNDLWRRYGRTCVEGSVLFLLPPRTKHFLPAIDSYSEP
jgi:hypothetical protein